MVARSLPEALQLAQDFCFIPPDHEKDAPEQSTGTDLLLSVQARGAWSA